MKLAYVTSRKRGKIDRLLAELAADLQANGLTLKGIVKDLGHVAVHDNGCDMSVRVLPDGHSIKITQNLGEGSDACRLDPAALAETVAQVEQSDFTDVDLFILNKFGPEEATGRGFCAVIGTALEHGIPVLVGVGGASITSFETFSGGIAERVPDDRDALRTWCEGVGRRV